MTYRRPRNRNDFHHSKQQIFENMLHWILLLLMVFQQLKTTAAAKYKGDNCFTKNQAGICKEWGECPIIKTLIESGEYTKREVVSCGFGIREELICCPVRAQVKTDDNDDRSGDHATTTTTAAPVKNIWLDLLKNETSFTTTAPDFWLHLLETTTATPTTSTTLKPLIIGEQKLNESSEFFDFNALLGGNQNAASKPSQTNNNPNRQPAFTANDSGRGNKFNTAPVHINEWSFAQTPNIFNNGRGNNVQPHVGDNGHANFGWGQQNNGRGSLNGQINSNRGLHMGRGPHNFFHNGPEHSHGHGPHNSNGRNPNIWASENQNQGFAFPQNSKIPNNFFGAHDTPASQSQVQSPNLAVVNTSNKGNVEQISNNKSAVDEKKVEDLINNIFGNMNFDDDDTDLNAPQNNLLLNHFNFNSPQPVVWFTPQSNDNNNRNVEILQFPTLNHKLESRHQQQLQPSHFETTPVAGNLINAHDLQQAPSTNFIQQPVLVQTWPTNAVPSQSFQPVHVVYENSVNSDMDIVNTQEAPLEPALSPQPLQVVVVQPQAPIQQSPQVIYQQQHFGESASKEPRSTSSVQQSIQQSETTPILNVQSPPTQILNPFKPFEFRPPPVEDNTFSEDNNSLSTNPSQRDTTPSTDRPAVKACRRIEENLPASLSPHILGGTPAELGEFPHMVAIGYSRIGGDHRPPYDIRCGGTLIDKRFVLTAAHCVSERENVPSIVRLGVVNFTDPKQMSAAVEIRINQTYIHDDYRIRLTYNDIAILELERDVEYNENIYPVCLYTDLNDPDPEIKLWVTGWGTVNTTTRSFSNILLKAPLHTSPLENCNRSFTDYGLNRRIPEGIRRTQFCAEDKDQIKDACQGDSGGPLNLIVDESYKNYRLVGVVSSGFGCASSTPGLYTRVSAFLDYIEKIVWPNGGD